MRIKVLITTTDSVFILHIVYINVIIPQVNFLPRGKKIAVLQAIFQILQSYPQAIR
jgi:hypothetical protein